MQGIPGDFRAEVMSELLVERKAQVFDEQRRC